MLGTPQGVYRFTVARADGGPLTVEAKPLAPHAEVTRMRVDGATLHVEGARRGRSRRAAPTCSPAAAATSWRSSCPRTVDGERFSREPRPRRARRSPASSATSGTCGCEVGRRSLRLGTHLDGIPNRSEATEYPAARDSATAAAPALLHDREQPLGALRGRPPRRPRPSRPSRSTRTPSRGSRAALLGPPAVARAPARAAAGGALAAVAPTQADGRDVRILLLHAWGMGGTVRATFEPRRARSPQSGRSVEVVSVVRRRERAVLPVPRRGAR